MSLLSEEFKISKKKKRKSKKEKEKPKCSREKAAVFTYEPEPPEWWYRPPCMYAFTHPKVRSRLERLMGSNLVRLTDRKYMLRLHDRILEDYIQTKNKRMADRENQEREREKNLILTGKLPFSHAGKEMANHPVLLINDYCEKLINERRALIKVPKVHIPMYLYVDDTPDPPSGLSISEGHVFRCVHEKICVPPGTHLEFTTEEDIERGYMFSADEYETKKKYEDPLLNNFEKVQNVEQMYYLADEIIGPLKTIKEERLE